MGGVAFLERSDEDLRFVANRVRQLEMMRRLIDGLQYTRERMAFVTIGIPTGRSFSLLPVRGRLKRDKGGKRQETLDLGRSTCGFNLERLHADQRGD